MPIASVLRQISLGRLVCLMAAVVMLTGAPRPAAADDWPDRTVTLVVPFPAGGSMDFIGRSIGRYLTETFGQTVVVENKTGAGGAIATNHVGQARPDGYTLLLTGIGPAVFRPVIDKTAGYDMDKEFTPVIMAADSPNVLLASPKLGLNSVKDLLAYAKKQEGRLNIGHPGPGTMGHLLAAAFANEAGVNAALVAYRGAPPMLTDLIGGQIDMGFPAFGPGSKAAKVLAVTTEERVDFLPDVPTMKESGFDVVGSTWNAIYAPANVPKEIVVKLNAAIDTYLRKPETRERFKQVGLRVLGGTPQQLQDRVLQDRAKWTKIIHGLNLHAAK